MTPLEAALAYAERGWLVHPTVPGTKAVRTRWRLGEADPLTLPAPHHGMSEDEWWRTWGDIPSSSDPVIIAAWWTCRPDSGVGVQTGRGSNLAIIDVDQKDDVDGEAMLTRLTAEHGALSETVEQRTPSGGRQILFCYPSAWRGIVTRTGLGGAPKEKTGVDVRGDGGQALLPPTIRGDGCYAWVPGRAPGEIELAELPDGWRTILEPAAPKIATPGPRPDVKLCDGTHPWVAAMVDGIVTELATWGADRNARLCWSSRRLHEYERWISPGEIESALMDACRSNGLLEEDGERQCRATIASGARLGRANPLDPPEREPVPDVRGEWPRPAVGDDPIAATDPDTEQDETFGPWRKDLLLTDGKIPKIKGGIANAVVFFRRLPALAGLLRWDERYVRAEWKSAPPWDAEHGPRLVVDSDAVEAVRWLAATERVAFSDKDIWTVMIAEAQRHPFDRVREYLDGLPAWDETPRANSWLTDLMGAEPTEGESRVAWTEYSSAVGAAWLVSAIARAMTPGCQADHMIVLEGRQGALKSSSLAALGGEFYADLSLDVGDKDALMQIHGPWICEWGELAGISKRESEAVKAFISRRVDRFRLPYGRTTLDYPRSCVFVGTTNEALSLSDASGNRRYWPIHVARANPDALADARDQLWAEALFRYRCGEQWWLSQDLEDLAGKQQEERLDVDAWEELVVYATEKGPLHGVDFVTTSQLCDSLNLEATAQNSGVGRRFARIMKRLGWRSGRKIVENQKPRGYFRPGVVIDLAFERETRCGPHGPDGVVL